MSALTILYSLRKWCADSPRMRGCAGWALHNFRGIMQIIGYGSLGKWCPLESAVLNLHDQNWGKKSCPDSNPEIFNQLTHDLCIDYTYWYFEYVELNEIYYLFHLSLFTLFNVTIRTFTIIHGACIIFPLDQTSFKGMQQDCAQLPIVVTPPPSHPSLPFLPCRSHFPIP